MRVVVAVADEGGYTAAAHRLRVAQSSLSRTVQEVEQRLGVRLFERTTRRVSTTRDGREFLTVARRALSEFDAALHHFEGYLEGSRGTVSIATLPSLAATMLPPVLAAYRVGHPEVVVRVSDGLSEEVLALLTKGDVDMALTVADQVPVGLEVQQIAVDAFMCLIPPGHPFQSRTEIRWPDLEGVDFVAFDPRSSIRTYVDRVLAQQSVTLGAVTEATNVGAVAGLTSSGLGVTVVPGLVLPMMVFAGLGVRPLVAPVVERDICVITDPRRPLSQAALGLRQLLTPEVAAAGDLEVTLPEGVRWA